MIALFGFTQGEGGDYAIYTTFKWYKLLWGIQKTTFAKERGFSLSIKGKIHGTINNQTKTIVGTIEKGTIEGNIGNIENNLIIRGTIIGIFKGSKDNKIVEQIIKGNFSSNNVFNEKGPFNNNTNEVFVAIQIETSLNGTINNVKLEENSHYNMFKMCKMYIEDASESEYQLWPVIEDPDVL